MRILFVGESWLGSCARSLKEALTRCSGVCVDEVNEDLFMPKPRARWLRAVNHFLVPAYRQELYRQIFYRVSVFKPDVVVVYKGFPITCEVISSLQKQGCLVVNVYPDCSPHAYGPEHQAAVGACDLVISTKAFHPSVWGGIYGYQNRCVYVPQGYDPALHLQSDLPNQTHFDVILAATWRPEYGSLMKDLGVLLAGKGISVGIGGNGWEAHRAELPESWTLVGEVQGRSYTDWLRQGKICIAPVTREVVINGRRQPGDKDTTRTYELAAAHCFFIHRRTELVVRLYDEHSEVPMYETPEELAEKIQYFLPRHEERVRMARAAHARAVPSYSTDSRATEIVTLLDDLLAANRRKGVSK